VRARCIIAADATHSIRKTLGEDVGWWTAPFLLMVRMLVDGWRVVGDGLGWWTIGCFVGKLSAGGDCCRVSDEAL
jgi:hypothetical protein